VFASYSKRSLRIRERFTNGLDLLCLLLIRPRPAIPSVTLTASRSVYYNMNHRFPASNTASGSCYGNDASASNSSNTGRPQQENHQERLDGGLPLLLARISSGSNAREGRLSFFSSGGDGGREDADVRGTGERTQQQPPPQPKKRKTAARGSLDPFCSSYNTSSSPSMNAASAGPRAPPKCALAGEVMMRCPPNSPFTTASTSSMTTLGGIRSAVSQAPSVVLSDVLEEALQIAAETQRVLLSFEGDEDGANGNDENNAPCEGDYQ